MALHYRDQNSANFNSHGSERFGPAMRDHGIRPSRFTAFLESAAMGAIAGALVSIYWIVGNGTSIVPTVVAFSLIFAAAAVALRLTGYGAD